MKLREYKLNILTKHITGKVNVGLPPAFFNHMVNELEEYIHVLNAILKGKMPACRDIHLHLLWLSDGAGHGAA